MDIFKIGQLDIGSHVFDIGKKFEFRVAAQNHPGYEGCTTLIAHRITGVAALDAAEPQQESSHPFILSNEFGSNIYRHSNIHQWLNSDKEDWYRKTTETDTPPVAELLRYHEQPYDSCSGYLSRFSSVFKNALVEKDIPVLERITRGKLQLTYVKAKVFLPSRTEMNKGNECGIAEGAPLPIFYDLSTYRAIPSDEDLKKHGRSWNPPANGGDYDAPQIYDPKHGWWYWMRTPNQLYSYLNRVMYTYGAVGYTYTNNDVVGVRPLFNVNNQLEVVRDNGPKYAYEIKAEN